MTAWKWLVAGIVLTSTAHAQFGGGSVPGAQGPPKGPEAAAAPAPVVEDVPAPKPATSQVAAVTLYQGDALVTREVSVPEGKGIVEMVVTPLPPRTIDGSLYTEAPDGFRVLSTRYRTRAVKEDTRQEVRAKEDQIKALQDEARTIQGDLHVLEQNLEFVQRLESFTGVTMKSLGEKGSFDAEKIIDLSNFVMETRGQKSASKGDLERRTLANQESLEFAKRQLAELSAGSSRTEIEAVIVLDKADAPAGSVRLNYLVGDATWAPKYRLRAGGPKDPVRLEYLAAIEQRSGEDWTDAELTLSTAQPSFSATLPDLLPLDVSVSLREEPAPPNGGFQSVAAAQAPESGPRAQAREIRGRAGQELLINNAKAGGDLLNQAAAIDQAEELLSEDDRGGAGAPSGSSAGPSVTYHLKGRRSIPSRREPQVVEVDRFEMTPDYFAKAVPVLSPRVFRLARLTNTGDSVLLPGEAAMFVGTDFVGRMNLPQVARGEPFTVGFGVDPQLQIGRRLVTKARAVQGGNQVLNYEFRIVARNFGETPVKLQVWDRLPKAESESVAVSLTSSKPDPSADPLYVRAGKPDGLLRWDLDVPAGTTGDKALTIVYAFKLEYAREVAIDYFKSGGLKESPIGGMGGMGGGMGGMGGGMRSLPTGK